jgi:two-component system KDP operon response regulator KdpE
MSHRFRLLAIDDDPGTLTILKLALSRKGFDVIIAEDAISGLRSAYQAHPDVILLDIMMPNMNGFDACRRLREMTDVPIIFVTARGLIEDVVRGLSSGADDYVVKPFECSELASRVMACLRRASERNEDKTDFIFPATSIVLDCGRHELMIDNRMVYLAPKEFEVLRMLAKYAGRVLSADAILNSVWGPEWVGEKDLLKQYIYRLRQKIEIDPDAPRYLHTVRGEGYYFDARDLL